MKNHEICCILNYLSNYIDSILAPQGIQYQMQFNESGLIQHNNYVVYDTEISNVGNVISYGNDGTFIINKTGTYIVDWIINIIGSESSTKIEFWLMKGSIPAIISYLDLNSTGTISGQALINLDAGQTLKVVNKTGNTLRFTEGPLQSSIRIIKT